MPNYTVVSDVMICKDGSTFIPADPANGDYRDYLAWVADGNVPDPSPATLVPDDQTFLGDPWHF